MAEPPRDTSVSVRFAVIVGAEGSLSSWLIPPWTVSSAEQEILPDVVAATQV